jgi:hypothetical protein
MIERLNEREIEKAGGEQLNDSMIKSLNGSITQWFNHSMVQSLNDSIAQ